jgi:hypothetical protein
MLPTFNIGKSVNDGIKIATSNNILIYNSSLVLKRKAFSKILNNKKQSYVLCTKDTKGDIGCIDDNNSLINCFFDIGHKVYDFLYLSEKDGLVLKNMCKSGMVKDNLYLFEIINLCIGQNMSISTLDVNEKEVKIENCYTTGNIIGYGAGGICGSGTGIDTKEVEVKIKIENCYTTGNVNGISYNNAGGICGTNTNNTTIQNCYTTGIIYCKYGGSICGTLSNNVLIINCFINKTINNNYQMFGSLKSIYDKVPTIINYDDKFKLDELLNLSNEELNKLGWFIPITKDATGNNKGFYVYNNMNDYMNDYYSSDYRIRKNPEKNKYIKYPLFFYLHYADNTDESYYSFDKITYYDLKSQTYNDTELKKITYYHTLFGYFLIPVKPDAQTMALTIYDSSLINDFKKEYGLSYEDIKRSYDNLNITLTEYVEQINKYQI